MFTQSNRSHLVVFQKNSYQIHLHYLLQKEHRAFVSAFRSFFAFLKPKPFIRSSTLVLLKSIHMNPKPYSLNQLIVQTKLFTPEQLSIFTQSNSARLIFSDILLKSLIYASQKNTRNALNYSLFKHKIHNYTTGKSLLKILEYKSIVNPVFKDFRISNCKPYNVLKLPNVTTISTYNWKSIN